MNKFVLIDGNALLYRAFHAYPNLTTSSGEMVNAVYGFSSMLLLVLERLNPENIVVVFDEKGPTFRHQQFTQYKAQRKPMDEGLVSQIGRTREVVRAFNIPIFAIPGYEADDILGTLVTRLKQDKETEFIIVTGDRDLLQLLDDNVKAFMPGKTFGEGVIIDVKAFQEKYGLPNPKQLIDLKALMGDQSDNIPGVMGIGEKGGQKLISAYGNIENLYEHIGEIEGKLKEKLVEGAEMAVLSKQLATIDCNVPVQFDIALCVAKDFDPEVVKTLFSELEFKSILKRVDRLGAGKLSVDSFQLSEGKESGMGDSQGSDSQVSVEKKVERNNGRQMELLGEDEGLSEPDEIVALEVYLKGQPEVIVELDKAMVPVLRRMKDHGVLVDKEVLSELSVSFGDKITQLVTSIYDDVGHEFNLNSPKQLSEVLFDELNLTVVKKTKTGRSTDEEVLKQLAVAHPAVEKILQYRELFKLKSTYIDGLPKFVAADSRIHSTFKLDVAATGRLSSVDPNLQNIPIKGSWGTEIRKAFVAPDGYLLLSLDYSQIELRILAHLAQDPGMIEIFQSGEDIHTSTAAKIFNTKAEEVSKDQRRSAKTINFGLMYGMGPHALAQDLKITFSQAQLFIKAYFDAFPKVKHYMDSVVEFGTKHGYVETIMGRKRFLPELQSHEPRLRSAGVRMAINMPCQGTQAEMIKKAMVTIDSKISRDHISGISMILQIHDDLLFEVREDLVGEWVPIIRKEMIDALPLSVPIDVGVNVGKSWGEMKGL